jgi:hypothetical protein
MLVVPITVVMPAAIIFIPPPMMGAVAILAGLVQFVPRAIRLAAVPAMMLDSFMKVVVGSSDAVLTLGFVRLYVRWTCKHQYACERRSGRDQLPELDHSQTTLRFHLLSCRSL